MPHVDVALVAEECEKNGVRTAVYDTPLVSVGPLSETLLFNNKASDLIITVGATLERIKLSGPDKILGGTEDTKIYCPDPIVQHACDSIIDVEEFLIAGVHDNLGGAKIIVKEY
jgi:hypothetical protein